MKLLTVVIPTHNEASCLPSLFDCLQRQTYTDFEIIVADNHSTDATLDLCYSRGVTIIQGGYPGVARNAGANTCTSRYILFLDADVVIGPNFIEDALNRFIITNAQAASFAFKPITKNYSLRIIHTLSVIFFWISSKASFPHGIGGATLVTRSSHFMVEGFNEHVLVAEDLDYVRRIAKVGRYVFLLSPTVNISVRRFVKEGVILMCLKWLLIEFHRVFLGEVHHNYFRYFPQEGEAQDVRNQSLL